MECKKCGTVAPEEATYCPNCGKRVDGKKLCHRCGKANEESFKFCIYCSARIDGKTVCKNCGEEHEGRFCPQCGANGNGVVKARQEKPLGRAKNTYRKVMEIVAVSCGLFSALAAMIFMFFIGGEGGGVSNVFYYFKDSFKDLKSVKEMMGGQYYSDAVNALGYAYTITTCIIAAAMLISVTVFFVLTAVRSVKALCHKATKSPITAAVFTAFCYVLGTALIYTMEAGEVEGIRISFNGVTVAGLVLCGAALAGGVACALLSDLTKFKNKAFIVRLICTGACIAMSAVAFVLIRNASAKAIVSVRANNRTESVEIGAPPLTVATIILSLFTEFYHGNSYSQLRFEMNMVSVFGILGAACLLAAVVFGTLALFRNVRNCTQKKYSSGMLWAMLSFACLVGTLVFEILLINQAGFIVSTTKVLGAGIALRREIAGRIVALVFAFINVGIAVAAKIVEKKHREREE